MLCAWYPFDGNCRNQGLVCGELNVTSTPNYTSGKFGKCLFGGGFSMTAKQVSKIFNNKSLSISFWFYNDCDDGKKLGVVNTYTDFDGEKLVYTEDNRDAEVILDVGDVGDVGDDGLFGNNPFEESVARMFSIFNAPTSNDLTLCWDNNTDNGRVNILNETLERVLPTRKWVHLCVTYENPTVIVWVNGEKKATYECVSASTSFDASTIIEDCSFRKYNDLRIYDEALSKKEVLDLYRGEVLHYTLSGGCDVCKHHIVMVDNDDTTYTDFGDEAFDVRVIDGIVNYTEYDCSGFKHNGEKIGIFDQSDDSPRYSRSYDINSTNSIQSDVVDFTGFKDDYSISVWVKATTLTNKMPFGLSDGNNLGLLFADGTIKLYTTSDTSNNFVDESGAIVSCATYADNNWHHFAIVGDGTSVELYVDGEKVGSAQNYKSLNGTAVHISGYSDDCVYRFTGQMSDFRIYSSVLNEEDIKGLYKGIAWIDKNYNLHCFELNADESKTNLDMSKRGIISTQDVEISEKRFEFKKDGVVLMNGYYED